MSNVIKSIREARKISLGVDVSATGVPLGDGHGAPVILPKLRHGDDLDYFRPTTVANEITIFTQHTGTHIDALSHIGKTVDGEIYLHGGYKADEVCDNNGFKVHDIAKQGPTIGRCVMLDIAKFKGVDVLEDSYYITPEDIKGTLEMEKAEIEPGDVVVIRTGFMRAYWISDGKRYTDKSAGISLDSAKYLIEEKKVKVIGSDTVAVEVIPAHQLEVHSYAMVDKGVPLMECMNLEELSEMKVYEFVIVIAPLRIVGATASMVNPIAIV